MDDALKPWTCAKCGGRVRATRDTANVPDSAPLGLQGKCESCGATVAARPRFNRSPAPNK